MSYRDMVTTDGRYVLSAISAFAHRRAQREFLAHAIFYSDIKKPNPFTYGELYKRELVNAWGWAFAIKRAGHGEAPVQVVPMWRRAA
jgi:hypothetical protein